MNFEKVYFFDTTCMYNILFIRYGGVTFGHKINVRGNENANIRRLVATEGIKVCDEFSFGYSDRFSLSSRE